MADPQERIAALEAEHRALTREMARTEVRVDQKVDSVLGEIKGLRAELSNIEGKLNRQRGFWAGVTFFASIVVFGLSQFWQFLASK